MKAVPVSDTHYGSAQQKVQEYQNYLKIAQQHQANLSNSIKKTTPGIDSN